jgi:hypothetical protein
MSSAFGGEPQIGAHMGHVIDLWETRTVRIWTAARRQFLVNGGTPAEWDELVEVIEEAAHEVLTLPVPPNWWPH